MRDLDEMEKLLREKDKEIKDLESQITRMKAYARHLESLIGEGRIEPHNARNAGRKKDDWKMQAQRERFGHLIESGFEMEEIMKDMQISRSTFYRLKKYFEAFGGQIKPEGQV